MYERLFERRIVLAHGELDDEAATSLCAQLLTLDAERNEPIRLEVQGLTAELAAALTVMGVLDVLRVPVRAYAGGQVGGPALGVLAAATERRAYPNAVFMLSEPRLDFEGSATSLCSHEEQVTGACWTRSTCGWPTSPAARWTRSGRTPGAAGTSPWTRRSATA